jgi:hypothetical protein
VVAPSKGLLPWAIAAAAAVAVVILVAVQRAGEPTQPAAAAPMAGVAAAPDISSMSPRERADRLYDRVMRLASEGKTDSATFFASMAVGAYASLSPFDADLRYDYGRMAEMSGDLALAQAQADAILAEQPDHLLGLVLSIRLAQRNTAKQEEGRLLTRLRAVRDAEYKKGLSEYERHRSDIDAVAAGQPR